jgi:hypothetical protein
MGYDNTNKGVLFPNQNRQKETHPHYKGEINIEGTEYWISGWSNVSKNGKKYLSMNVSKKDSTYTKKPIPQKDDFLNDDVPLTNNDPSLKTDDFEEDDIPF